MRGDQFIDGLWPFERMTEIAVREFVDIGDVLLPEWIVEVIALLDVALHFGQQ